MSTIFCDFSKVFFGLGSFRRRLAVLRRPKTDPVRKKQRDRSDRRPAADNARDRRCRRVRRPQHRRHSRKHHDRIYERRDPRADRKPAHGRKVRLSRIGRRPRLVESGHVVPARQRRNARDRKDRKRRDVGDQPNHVFHTSIIAHIRPIANLWSKKAAADGTKPVLAAARCRERGYTASPPSSTEAGA